MGKTGLRDRGKRVARSLAVVAALLMMGLSLGGTAQAQSGGNADSSAIGLAGSVGAQSTTVNDKQCFYTYPSCSSSNPSVKFTIVSDGDTSGCTFQTTADWGDKSSSTQTYAGGANGSTMATFDHTYTDEPRTYTITVTSETTVGACGNANGTLDFTLTSSACTSSAAATAGQCVYCPAPAEPSALGAPAESASPASYFYAQAYTPDITGNYAAGTFKVADRRWGQVMADSLAELAVASRRPSQTNGRTSSKWAGRSIPP